MDLYNKNILIVSGFAAEYGGNFILMLKSLAARLKKEYQCKIFFVFPQQVQKQWLCDLSKEYIVRFTQNTYSKTAKEILAFINEYDINLIHTHFEVYDIPVAKAIRSSKREIKSVWHLHDHMTLEKRNLSFALLRKLKTHLNYWLQYGFWGRKAFFAGVSAEVTHIATHYREHIFKFPKMFSNDDFKRTDWPYAEVVINGIDISRINKTNEKKEEHKYFRFLTFGGDAFGKGISTILKASEILKSGGCRFELVITNGYKTPQLLEQYFGNQTPEWLKIVNQTNNISQLFNACDAYISASLYETMSMAIAEASIFGLPIIQSDIPGTLWNSDTPSSFLFKVEDAADLAIKMKTVIESDKELLQEQCNVSSQINTRRLDMNLWCEKIANIYKRL